MADDTTSKRTPATPAPATPAPDERAGQKPGDERLDMNRTPGDGSLQGSTPAGLTVKELRERAEEDGSAQPGTG